MLPAREGLGKSSFCKLSEEVGNPVGLGTGKFWRLSFAKSPRGKISFVEVNNTRGVTGRQNRLPFQRTTPALYQNFKNRGLHCLHCWQK